jgi:carbonic anhydrase
MDLIYRFDPFQPVSSRSPADADAALTLLREGNERFAEIVAKMQERVLGGAAAEPLVVPVCPVSLGLPLAPGMALKQSPFALVLGCSDARVPTEEIFDQSFNNLFVVRIAGNVLGTECVGSVDYAVRHLGPSLKVAVVLGHSGCGAVAAAVAGYETPADYVDIAFTHALRSLVDRIQIAVRGASRALRQFAGNDVVKNPGYSGALAEVAVYLNAALTAFDLRREIEGLGSSSLPVVYGVCDLGDLRVRSLPASSAAGAVPEMFAQAPQSPDDFVLLAGELAKRAIASFLGSQ